MSNTYTHYTFVYRYILFYFFTAVAAAAAAVAVVILFYFLCRSLLNVAIHRLLIIKFSIDFICGTKRVCAQVAFFAHSTAGQRLFLFFWFYFISFSAWKSELFQSKKKNQRNQMRTKEYLHAMGLRSFV